MEQKHLGLTLIVLASAVMVFAQLLFKNRLNYHGAIPFRPAELAPYIWQLMQDWKVWVGGAGLILSAFMWYSAISRLPLSYAFPFAALSYPIIFLTSVVFLGEAFSYTKLFANLLIVSGVVLIGISNTS